MQHSFEGWIILCQHNGTVFTIEDARGDGNYVPSSIAMSLATQNKFSGCNQLSIRKHLGRFVLHTCENGSPTEKKIIYHLCDNQNNDPVCLNMCLKK